MRRLGLWAGLGLALVASAAGLAAWQGAGGAAPVGADAPESGSLAPDGPRNVVLVLADTLRADHLGAYGYGRNTSPFLDALAAQGVLFEDVTSAAPSTFPAVNSLLTSRHPTPFYRRNAKDLGIEPRLTTLAEALRASGFRTAAVSSSPIVRASPSEWNRTGGFGQGFEHFDESCGGSGSGVRTHSAGCVAARAIGAMHELAEERFFLYVHFLDPHAPYQPPAPWNRFVRPYDDKGFVASGRVAPIFRWLYEDAPDPEVGARDLRHLEALYDGEIRAVDAALSRMMKALDGLGLARDTLFVLVSDHGESFMEHGHMAHGHSLYQHELRVPLLFHWPERWQGERRRRKPVCTVDVMPTLLELVGAPVPEGSVGRPLFAAGAAGREPGRCYAEGRANWSAKRAQEAALRRGATKLIHERGPDRYELYDLASDPGEEHDLAGEPGAAGERLAAMKRTLRRHAPEAEAGASEESVALDPDAEGALRALGYIE